jgi:N-terminal acetyltransferase B complex catalytic subunit
MTATKLFLPSDLFDYNNVNFDPLTATYDVSYYLSYLARWPDYNFVSRSFDGKMMGYILGKAEGPHGMPQESAQKIKKWHGHVTAVTVTPDFRRLGLASELMYFLELVSEKHYDAWFVDLFVRASNVAIKMYEKLGYVVYRRVKEYYHDDGKPEDGLDMRKSCPKDKEKVSEIPLGRDIYHDEIESTL